MRTVDFANLEMIEAWYENDPEMRITVNFPFFAATGNQHSAVVYFEIEPGHYLGEHTDSAEEILFILSGSVDAIVGLEHGRLSQGQAALVPAMTPHSVRNSGQDTCRCVGFFGAASVQSTFDQPMMPFGQQTVGTPPVEVAV